MLVEARRRGESFQPFLFWQRFDSMKGKVFGCDRDIVSHLEDPDDKRNFIDTAAGKVMQQTNKYESEGINFRFVPLHAF